MDQNIYDANVPKKKKKEIVQKLTLSSDSQCYVEVTQVLLHIIAIYIDVLLCCSAVYFE